MSEEQTPQTSGAECSAMHFTEFEDEERWLFEVLGIKPRPPSALDGDTAKKQDKSLGHAKSSLRRQQATLEGNKINNADDSDTCQAEYTEDDDETSHSDSDADDNVKVIIGDIKTNPSMYIYRNRIQEKWSQSRFQIAAMFLRLTKNKVFRLHIFLQATRGHQISIDGFHDDDQSQHHLTSDEPVKPVCAHEYSCQGEPEETIGSLELELQVRSVCYPDSPKPPYNT
ncbi:hypothetical protein STEG23_013796 [Scotinomys teguina]